MNKQLRAFVFVLLAGCMWGCMGLLVRPLDSYMLSSMDIVALRAFVTLILTLTTLPILCKLSQENVKDAVRIKRKDIWVFVGTGIVSVVFFNFCYFNTIILTNLSVAAILLYTSPIFVMLISLPVFREKITRIKLLALGMAFVGCGVVTGAFTGSLVLSVKGLLFGLGAGFGYALYSIFGKIATDKGYSSVTVTLYTFLFASVGVIPFIDMKKITDFAVTNPRMALYSLILIIITTYLPYIFYTSGLAGLTPGKAAIVATIEPVAATFVGLLAFKESINVLTVVGVVLVIGAIVLVNLKWCKNERNKFNGVI